MNRNNPAVNSQFFAFSGSFRCATRSTQKITRAGFVTCAIIQSAPTNRSFEMAVRYSRPSPAFSHLRHDGYRFRHVDRMSAGTRTLRKGTCAAKIETVTTISRFRSTIVRVWGTRTAWARSFEMDPHAEGHKAAREGKPYLSCPYLGDAKRAWQNGWHAGPASGVRINEHE